MIEATASIMNTLQSVLKGLLHDKICLTDKFDRVNGP